MTSIADILRDATIGLELYCPVIGKVKFLGLKNKPGIRDGIYIENVVGTKSVVLDEFGRWTREGQCVLFPSDDQMTWEKWQNKLFRPGDFITGRPGFLAVAENVTLVIGNENTCRGYDSTGTEVSIWRPGYRWATKEEIDSFMDNVKENGLCYNVETCEFSVLCPEERLPETWEEFCEKFPVTDEECFIDEVGNIEECEFGDDRTENLLPDLHTAEAMSALCQLIQLRNCYNGNWKPSDGDDKFEIMFYDDEIKFYHTNHMSSNPLYFKNNELCEKFIGAFRPMIEKLKPMFGCYQRT